MDYEKYLENISNLDDFDEFHIGLLEELEEEAPKELHENVMNIIRNENKIVKYFRYRKYMPVAAAAAILIAALTFINNPGQDKRISLNPQGNNNSVEQAVKTDEKQTIPARHPYAVNSGDNSNANNSSSDNAKKTNTDAAQPKSNNKASKEHQRQVVAVNGKDSTKNSQNQKSGLDADQNKSSGLVAVNDGKTANFNPQGIAANTGNSNAAISSEKDNTGNGTVNEEPAIKYSLAFGNEKPIQNFVAKVYGEDNTINYEVALSMDQIDIIDFINSRGTIISYRVYRLSREDANLLDVLLSSKQIKKEVINEANDSDSVIIKLTISNDQN